MKDLLILRRIHLSKAPATFIRPTWWQKKVKNLKKGVSQTVFPLFSYQDGFLATWDPSQMKDLKILHQIHLTRALYDGIWPSLCRLKVPKFMFFCDKNVRTYHKPLFITSFALLDITTGQMGNAIYLFFLHKIKLIPSLPPISHLSGGVFPWYSLGTRTKGQTPYATKPLTWSWC